MNKTVHYLSLCAKGKAIEEKDVLIDFSLENCRKSDPNVDELIENIWTVKLKQNFRLFNASKFRLEHVEKKDSSVVFHLGITCYKDFLGTNGSPNIQELINLGISKYRKSHAYFANPVGVGSFVQTLDNKFIFIKRSEYCAEAPNFVDRPGGHPEPDEVIKTYGCDIEHVKQDAIAKELFFSVIREIRDEVNIPIQNLSSPVLLGISYNTEMFNRPSLEFYTSCNLTSEEVYTKYQEQTHCESYESTELVILSLEEILNLAEIQSGNMWSKLTPASKSAIILYSVFHE